MRPSAPAGGAARPARTAALVLALLFARTSAGGPAAPGPALQDEDGACCSAAADEGRVCDHAAPAELGPLPADATAKERRLRAIHERSARSLHPYLGLGGLEAARAELAAAANADDPRALQGAHWLTAHYALGAGDVEGAVEHFRRAHALIADDESLPDAAAAEVLYRLGLAHFRLAERQNCIAHHGTESCILPLSRAAVHVDQRGAKLALEAFTLVLELDPGHLESRWLLNVAAMALGRWPDGVPAGHRYPPERFRSEREVGRFRDVAPALGLNRLTRAGGAVMDDFDGDGLLDVLTSTMDTGRPVRLFRNVGDGTFRDVTEAAGLARQLGGLNLVHGDADGNGLLDVLVLRGGELGTEGEMPESLLLQVRPGVFADVTEEAGLERAAPSQTAAFADVDGDGDLDLFVGYETRVDGGTGEVSYPSALYENDGPAPAAGDDEEDPAARGGPRVPRFVDVTAEAGIANRRRCVGAVFGDVDGDGDPDLYLSNLGDANRLYRNEGGWRFADVAAAAGVTGPRDSYATWFFDPDNDGDLDLFVAHRGYLYPERAVARWFLDGTVEGDTIALYENDGSGRFRDATAERGLRRALYALGGSFGDLDGDGWSDAYLGTGSSDMAALWPNALLQSDGGRRFEDVTFSAGVGHLQKGNGTAFGDLDEDGDQDLLVQVGGYHLDDAFWDVLFENPGHGGRWLTVRLEGVRSNRFGLGARVRVRIVEGEGEERRERDVLGHVGTNGSFGGNSLQQELGLGRATRVLLLEVRWPAGSVQRFDEVPLDRVVVVREGEPALAVLEPRRLRLGPDRVEVPSGPGSAPAGAEPPGER